MDHLVHHGSELSPLPLFLHLRQQRQSDTMNVKVTEQMATMALKLEVGSILPNFSRLILAMGLEEEEEAESVLDGTAGKDCILEDDARPGEEERVEEISIV